VELITVQEAASLLKVSSITVRRYVAAGRLPAVKVGKAVRLRREAIEQFVTPVAPRPDKILPVKPRRGVFSRDDSLWNIVGLVKSGGPADVSENKHEYLAEANR
jgi:excisionase family DNA binding protein